MGSTLETACLHLKRSACPAKVGTETDCALPACDDDPGLPAGFGGVGEQAGALL